MAVKNNFNTGLPDHTVNGQVARLLNSNNRLTKVHTVNTITTSPVQYFVELHGQTVVGCVGLISEPTMDKIVHLSVAQSARRLGIGAKLLYTAIGNSMKDTIYMHIREDNVGSRRVATRTGFNAIAYIPKFNYNILTFCLFRRNNVSRNRS